MGFFKKLLHGDWSNPFDNAASGTKNVFEGMWNDSLSNGPERLMKMAGIGGMFSSGGGFWKNVFPALADFGTTWYANEQSAKSAEDQMAFQLMMSNTAYQRAMADLAKAGLNPSLAYQQGGASTGSGASYEAKKADVAQTALGSMSLAQQRKFQDVQMDNIFQQTSTGKAAQAQAEANAAYLDRQMKLAEANTALTDQQRQQGAEIFREQLRKAAFDATTAGKQADYIDKQIEQIDQNMLINTPRAILGLGAKTGLNLMQNPPATSGYQSSRVPYWEQSTGQPPEDDWRNGSIPQHYLGVPR